MIWALFDSRYPKLSSTSLNRSRLRLNLFKNVSDNLGYPSSNNFEIGLGSRYFEIDLGCASPYFKIPRLISNHPQPILIISYYFLILSVPYHIPKVVNDFLCWPVFSVEIYVHLIFYYFFLGICGGVQGVGKTPNWFSWNLRIF